MPFKTEAQRLLNLILKEKDLQEEALDCLEKEQLKDITLLLLSQSNVSPTEGFIFTKPSHFDSKDVAKLLGFNPTGKSQELDHVVFHQSYAIRQQELSSDSQRLLQIYFDDDFEIDHVAFDLKLIVNETTSECEFEISGLYCELDKDYIPSSVAFPLMTEAVLVKKLLAQIQDTLLQHGFENIEQV